MKQIIFALFIFILVSCNRNYNKEDLLGTWECISSKNKVTNEVIYPNSDKDVLIVEFRSDSLYYFDELLGDVYAWQVKGDSILIKDLGSVYIKELTANSLIVGLDFFDEIDMTFKKVK